MKNTYMDTPVRKIRGKLRSARRVALHSSLFNYYKLFPFVFGNRVIRRDNEMPAVIHFLKLKSESIKKEVIPVWVVLMQLFIGVEYEGIYLRMP